MCLGNSHSSAASFHGSTSNRQSAERTVSGISFSVRADRRVEKVAELRLEEGDRSSSCHYDRQSYRLERIEPAMRADAAIAPVRTVTINPLLDAALASENTYSATTNLPDGCNIDTAGAHGQLVMIYLHLPRSHAEDHHILRICDARYFQNSARLPPETASAGVGTFRVWLAANACA